MTRPTRPTQLIPAIADAETEVIGKHALSEPKVRRVRPWAFMVVMGVALIAWAVIMLATNPAEPSDPPAVRAGTTSVGPSPTPTPPGSSTATTAGALLMPTETVTETETVYVDVTTTVVVTQTVTNTVTATPTPTVTPTPSPTPPEPPQ